MKKRKKKKNLHHWCKKKKEEEVDRYISNENATFKNNTS